MHAKCTIASASVLTLFYYLAIFIRVDGNS